MPFEDRKFLFDVVDILLILDIFVEVFDAIARANRSCSKGARGDRIAINRVLNSSAGSLLAPSSVLYFLGPYWASISI